MRDSKVAILIGNFIGIWGAASAERKPLMTAKQEEPRHILDAICQVDFHTDLTEDAKKETKHKPSGAQALS